jgi:DNA-binding NtrC family response regulator
VVDDEALIRWSLTQMLGEHGFEVDEASNGAEALAAGASDKRFDAVLLDFRLPDSDDLELLEKLRRLMPTAAVILMTAFSTPEIAEHAMELGAVSVVTKPFELHQMAEFVRQVC